MSFSNETIASYKVATLLEEASEHSENMLDNTPGILVILNGKNRVIRANKEFCNYLNIPMEECLHINFESLFSEEDRKIFIHHVDQLKRSKNTGSKVNCKLDMIIPKTTAGDQEPRQVFWQMYRNDKKSAAEEHLITVTGRDLSEVYRSEMKLMNIFSSLPLGMVILNNEGRIEEVLSEYCEILFEEKDLEGKEFKSFFNENHDDDGRRINDGIDKMVACIGEPKSVHVSAESSFPTILSMQTNDVDEDGDPVIKWIKLSQQPIFQNGMVASFILTLEDISETVYSKREVERIRLLEKQSMALYECAIRDPLSGLYTRLFMKDSVKNLVDSFQRGNISELSLVLFDIDFFKLVNDNHGHPVGDQVIQEVGSIIKKESRDSDLAVRYGGEEFLVILPSKETSYSSGSNFAERVRSSVESKKFDLPNGDTLQVTISAGIAYCQHDETLPQLINRADQLLYKAKNNGRNQCVSQQTKL